MIISQVTERKGKGSMARKQNTPTREEWKAALVELVKEVIIYGR
jgi:stalled ribosome alternative rescue factor ArfA